ncbi:MAG: PEGA domain-containing protein [Acidobacteria bacterium]|nr:PEGA domain-containing protein [Acidobacteriota bacterium]
MSGLPRVAVRHPDALTPQVIALDPLRDSLDAFAPQATSSFPRVVPLPVTLAPPAPAGPVSAPLALAPRPAALALEPVCPPLDAPDDELQAEDDEATAYSTENETSPATSQTAAVAAREHAVLRVPRWLGVAGMSMSAGALGSLCTMLLVAPPPPAPPAPQAPLAALPFTVAPAAARPIVPVPARWEVGTAPSSALPSAPSSARSSAPPSARSSAPSSESASAPGASARLMPTPPPAPPGFLSLTTPFAVRVLVDGVEMGGGPRLSLPAGTHVLTMINDELEFAETREVQIEARKALTITVDTPRGVLHVNARPWADVWIDGRRVGETPVGNVSLPIGAHEVLLRHPQFGESRHTVIVGAKTPARLAVELQP